MAHGMQQSHAMKSAQTIPGNTMAHEKRHIPFIDPPATSVEAEGERSPPSVTSDFDGLSAPPHMERLPPQLSPYSRQDELPSSGARARAAWLVPLLFAIALRSLTVALTTFL